MADDRELLEGKYTAPSGKEFIFLWEKTSKTTELKTGIFTFPDKNGAHVQHQGGGPVNYPLVCIFNDDNHIKIADNFEAALLETEIAELQHPVYGIKKVKPTGNIVRDNDYVTSLNETRVSITFTENITDEATTLEAVTADEIESMYDDFSEAAAIDFSESITVENVSEQLQIQSALETQANLLNDNLSDIMSTTDSGGIISGVNKKSKLADFLTSMKELKNNITGMFKKVESVVQKAINIARLALNIMKLPSRIITNITEKIKGYTQLITAIVNQFKNDPFGINNIKNAFASTRLVLTGAVASIASGAALSIAETAASGGGSFPGESGNAEASSGILTRESAVDVAIQLNELLNTIQNFEDDKIGENNFIDSNANTYLMLIQLVHKSIQLILDVTFYLPMKRTIKLDRDRNFIELCAELYGSVNNYYLDKLIIENNLNIDELEIIPMGREVTYFVKSA
ncbi:hypothetical protein FACS189447_07900 [Spirochaetia bacterium]|nr:hypothetical protein FACS189447_07900 [Spirochaetia bacterium]